MHERQCQRIARFKRQLAGQQLVGDDTEVVEIGASIYGIGTRLLGTHLRTAADGQAIASDARIHATGRKRDAEIRELWSFRIVEEDVFGLDVAMHDAARVRVVEGIEDGLEQRDQAVFVVTVVAHAEVALGEIRHHVVEIALLRAADFVDDDDAGMLELGDDPGFLFEAHRLRFLEPLGRAHDLDRDLALKGLLHGKIDRRHAAKPEPSHDAVARDDGIRRRSHGRIVSLVVVYGLHRTPCLRRPCERRVRRTAVEMPCRGLALIMLASSPRR